VLVSRCHAKIAASEFQSTNTIRVVHGDATTTEDLSEATVVFIYLVPKGIAKVQALLEAVVRTGGRVVSNVFAVPGWTPTTRVLAKGLPVYLYDSVACLPPTTPGVDRAGDAVLLEHPAHGGC
jgi:hypothetical protein